MSPLGQVPGLESLRSMTRGDPRVVVAILDGPVETEHACLSGARLQLVTLDAAGASGSSTSRQHGTHVTSQIFANSDCGLMGIAPDCSGLLIPIFGDAENGGLAAASQIDLARGIRLAVDRGANIINISGGQLSPTPEAEQFLADALAYCDQAGVLVVAAAGNNGCECLHVPASIASVLAVGAFDPATGEPLEFSNWGPAYRNNGILAPGKDMPGAQAGGGLTSRTGTSFATPIVTGVAALLMSVQLDKGMAVDAPAVRTALLQGATRCDETVAEDCRPYLAGKLDVNTAVGLLGGEVDAAEPLPAATALDAHRQHVKPAACEVSRDGVAVAALPDAAEQGGIACAFELCNSDPHRLSETHAPEARSVQASISTDSEERPTSERGRRFVGTETIRVVLPAGPRDRKGQIMLGEKDDNGGGQPGSDIAEPTASAGVEASGIAVQKGTPGVLPSGVTPSGECACGGGGGGGCGCASCAAAAQPQLVFALGELGYDLVSEARKDSLWQAMHHDPYEWTNLANHLRSAPWDAEAVTWTLRIDATPIYAIRPMGPYAADAYKRLAEILIGQLDEKRKIERLSLPGWIAGSATLSNGVSVPVVVPALRGMFAWDTTGLVKAVTKNAAEHDRVANFLNRVYYELRNLGQSPQERAQNFAATNAFQVSQVFHTAVGQKQELDTIGVVKSPICRQDSDCWDVTLTFFDPQNDRAARTVYRFTVDVSDVVPCTVGAIRSWSIR